ncbi:MAG TPA: 16S rRNA (guanine(966)-N(2))-methyltransferase RsmD [Caulobacteraceae bacterium]|nr:16S rRNA (guanine(966)-N(2))-methyltransferase RsmD [Caulobacteraceae bacterium]
MRIVAGTFRGRPLVAPKGHSVRPTAERARQAMFNILEHAAWSPGVEDARVIDLFAGAGGLGLEAISRGAAFCRFVELDETALGAIRANAASLGVADKVAIDRRDGARLSARPIGGQPPFDLAFVDPPYGKGLGETALRALASGGWLEPGAIVVLERGWREGAETPEGYGLLDERLWGAARVSFLRYSGA